MALIYPDIQMMVAIQTLNFSICYHDFPGNAGSNFALCRSGTGSSGKVGHVGTTFLRASHPSGKMKVIPHWPLVSF